MITDQPAQDAEDVRTWGKDCFASTCPWCKCKGYHSEVCEGFEVNDPAARVVKLMENLEQSLATAKQAAKAARNDGSGGSDERT
jgi:hypothetical protein